MIRIIIAEDQEKDARRLTEELRQNFPQVEVLAVCPNVESAISEINRLKPQLVFLDVNLEPNRTGFEVLEATFQIDYKVIFTTAYSEHAKRAFEFCTIDFIEKPYSLGDLQKAITRFEDGYKHGFRSEKLKYPENQMLVDNWKEIDLKQRKIAIPVQGAKEFIRVGDIIMCQADKSYFDIFLTGNRKMTVSKNLGWVEERLIGGYFYRVHDAYLINIEHIEKFKNQGEGGLIKMAENHEADVSKRKKEGFLSKLQSLGIDM